jgi:hypothetical protein
MLIANFLMFNAMRGFLLAMLYAAAKFFITGEHIGEMVFLMWFAAGTFISLLLKFLEAVEIYDKLKEMNNDR